MYVKVYITTHRQQRVHTDHSNWQTGEVALTRFPDRAHGAAAPPPCPGRINTHWVILHGCNGTIFGRIDVHT